MLAYEGIHRNVSVQAAGWQMFSLCLAHMPTHMHISVSVPLHSNLHSFGPCSFFYHTPESVILTSVVYARIAAVLFKGLQNGFLRATDNCKRILTYNHALVSEYM
jgi:hypothetical protein